MGNFMYISATAPRNLQPLIAAGNLDLTAIRLLGFPQSRLEPICADPYVRDLDLTALEPALNGRHNLPPKMVAS
jgi:hypothetical protein